MLKTDYELAIHIKDKNIQEIKKVNISNYYMKNIILKLQFFNIMYI